VLGIVLNEARLLPTFRDLLSHNLNYFRALHCMMGTGEALEPGHLESVPAPPLSSWKTSQAILAQGPFLYCSQNMGAAKAST
jgi:hypothetical protein